MRAHLPPAATCTVRTFKPETIIALAGVVIAAIGLAATNVWLQEVRTLGGDRAHYFSLGHNLYHHGIYAISRSVLPTGWPEGAFVQDGETEKQRLKPTAYREPGYPFLVVGLKAVMPFEASADFDCLAEARPPCQDELLYVIGAQGVLLALILVIVGFATYSFVLLYTGSAALVSGFWSLGAVLLTWRILTDFPNPEAWNLSVGTTEMPATLLFLVLSLTLRRLIRNPSLVLAVLCGLTAGCLALTKAVFVYLVWPLAIVLLLAVWGCEGRRDGSERRWRTRLRPLSRATAISLVVLASFYLVVGPWLLRNHVSTGSFVISEKGPQALAVRAFYDRMTWREYLVAFPYWTPRLNGLIVRHAPPEWYAKLDRSNPDGYYRRGKDLTSASVQAYFERNRELRGWNDVHSNEVTAMLLDHAGMHVAATIPFFYRGLYFAGFIGPLLMLSVGAWAYRGIRERRWHDVAMLLPLAYSIGIHSFFTNNITRYSTPITGIAVMTFVVLVADVLRRRGSPWSGRS